MHHIIDREFNSNAYKLDQDHIKIIAWKNATVKALNTIVRKSLFGENIGTFVKGDRLVANKPLFERKIDSRDTID